MLYLGGICSFFVGEEQADLGQNACTGAVPDWLQIFSACNGAKGRHMTGCESLWGI